jgi:phage-related protein|nr:MAG TPA: distal tail protein [Caudoviricetes sp.]
MAELNPYFIYNGVSSANYGVKCTKFAMPIAPTMNVVSESIPGAYGNYFEGINYTSKSFTFKVYLDTNGSRERMQEITDQMAEYLILYDEDNPAREYELEFGFWPDRFWLGHFSSIGQPTLLNNSWFATVDLTFECSKPFTFLNRETIALDGVTTGKPIDVNMKGNAPTPVDIQIESNKDAKHVGVVVNGSGIFALGEDRTELQNKIVAEWQEALSDVGDATSGSFTNWNLNPTSASNIKWGQRLAPVMGGSNMINPSGMSIGVGTKEKTGYNPAKDKKGSTSKYTVMNYGTDAQEAKGTTGTPWYGPIMITKGFDGGALDDFKAVFRLKRRKFKGPHNGRAMGDIEVLFLDPNGNAFFRAGIKDQDSGAVPVLYTQIGKPGTDWISGDYVNIYGPAKAFNIKNGRNVKVPVYAGSKKVKKSVTVIKKVRGKKKKVTTQEDQTVYYYKTEMNDNNTSELSNAWIEWEVHKVGNVWSFWIYQLDQGGNRVKDYEKGKVHFKNTKYIDRMGDYSAPLGSIAVGMFKHSITEDTTNPPNIYRNVDPSLTMLKVWRRNPKYDLANKPIPVAVPAGSVLDFDGENMQTTVNGTVVEEAWATNYPKLQPGNNTLVFVSDADLSTSKTVISYNPRLK